MQAELLNKINEKLSKSPLIYVCIELERALGLEEYLENYHIITYENSEVVDMLLEKGVNVHSVPRITDNLPRKTTSSIISNSEIRQLIETITSGKNFYLITFHPTKPFEYQASKYNCTLLNNSTEISSKYEDKLKLAEIFDKEDVGIPSNEQIKLEGIDWKEISEKYNSDRLVFQTSKSHTGEGTYIVSNEHEYNTVKSNASGEQLKVSEYVEGDSWTINASIGEKIILGGLSYQITGVESLTSLKGATVGNDWSYSSSLSESVIDKITKLTETIGEKMKTDGYKGLFGIDFIVNKEGSPILIEINARQTANIPMQTYLEINQNVTPLSLIGLADLLEINYNLNEYTQINSLKGSQVFNRAKSKFTIKHTFKSGVYRLQSDNSSIDWHNMQVKDNVIYIDEEKDKPLIFKKAGYNVSQIEQGGILIKTKHIGEYKFNSEIIRMQFLNQIINNGNLAPWIAEAMKTMEEHLL